MPDNTKIHKPLNVSHFKNKANTSHEKLVYRFKTTWHTPCHT